MGDQPSAMPLSTQDSTTQEDKNKHPCRKWDSNPLTQRPSDQGPCPTPRGHWDRLIAFWSRNSSPLLNPIGHYSVHENPSWDLFLKYLTRVHALKKTFKIHLYITLPSTSRSPKWSLLVFRFSYQRCVWIFCPSWVPHALPILPSLFDRMYYTWWWVHITNLLIVQFRKSSHFQSKEQNMHLRQTICKDNSFQYNSEARSFCPQINFNTLYK
jgi:hypothetical protein